MKLIRFQTDVLHVTRAEGRRWLVRSRKVVSDEEAVDMNEVFDAVVVCNGHHTEPRVAEIPGDVASGADISRDIAPVAEEVHISSRTALIQTTMRQPGYDNIYKYYFPFLETNGVVTVDDNRVGPLYKHVFPPSLAPSLSFIGIPWKILPFPMFELQCKWVAGILSEKILLPTELEMMEDVEAFYSQIQDAGYPKRYTHNMSEYQFEYDDWLAMKCGCPMVESWRKGMFEAALQNWQARPETHRDESDGHDLVLQAQELFLSLEKLKIR
ncbi:hypothetical protein EJ110_NYTH32333 [Nymphaea thermarum]|nr:hypothetical protein EJ110_NYTH32333 [Nymphaea thermarum]